MNVLKRLKLWLGGAKKEEIDFVGKCKGIVHIGANLGQERFKYAEYDLPVLWIEPIPEIFEQLKLNIAPFQQQRALRHLLTAVDGEPVTFNISNNEGQSSSILDLHLHKDVWPDIDFNTQLKLIGETFEQMVLREGVDLSHYDGLALDTQGSELLVLQGFGELISHFRYIKTEAADFEAYKGCCTIETLQKFLAPSGFAEVARELMIRHPVHGAYYDLYFEKAK